jgi:sulfite reductase (NADPH) flavoprotein alpha-component
VIRLIIDTNIKIAISIVLFVLWFALTLWKLLSGKTNKNEKGQEFLILYASQNGQSEEIAIHTQKVLLAGKKTAGLMALGDVKADDLFDARKILVIASTTGIGDAPINAIKFEKNLIAQKIDLSTKEYAILALGDKNYPDFCAFGKRLSDWFTKSGAYALSDMIMVDDLDKKSLQAWDEALKQWGGHAIDEGELFHDVPLVARELLNPNSNAADLYEIEFNKICNMQWQAGDLCEILTPDGHRRDYSIATIESEKIIRLYVRLVTKDNGEFGLGSGYLAKSINIGDTVKLRLKSHKNFHTPNPMGATIMVAAGSGYAGLRPHILSLSERGEKIWIFYGERTIDNDGYLVHQIKNATIEGKIMKADFTFSRLENAAHKYVQNLIEAKANEIREFIGNGGNIIICGGLDMGLGVGAALKEILGEKWLDDASAEGRYLRDLY